MKQKEIKLARFSDDFKNIIDSSNNKVAFDDPRVVFVFPCGINNVTSRLIGKSFEKQGWKFRFTGEASSKTLTYAKNLCSGRECLSCLNITGETYKDIMENRLDDEISVYYNFDLPGPCQSGA